MTQECLLLSGEAYVGDMLLRAGKYQLVRRGSTQGELASDGGALLFVHGDAAYAAPPDARFSP